MNYQLKEDEMIELMHCLRYKVFKKTKSEIIFKHEDLDLTMKVVKKERYHLVDDVLFAYHKVSFAYGEICGSYKYHIGCIVTKNKTSEREKQQPGCQPKRFVLISLDGKEENEFYQLGIYLKDRGYHVTHITRQKNKDQKIFEMEDYKLIPLPFSKMKPDELIKKTVSIFHQELEKPDIIHSMNWMSGACGYEICKKFKLRHLHSVTSLGRGNINRHKMTDKEIFRDNYELKIFSSAEFLIVPSVYLGESLKKLYPNVIGEKVKVIPPGVDHEQFKPRHTE